jgi:uncharacterized lipoprotein YbaY
MEMKEHTFSGIHEGKWRLPAAFLHRNPQHRLSWISLSRPDILASKPYLPCPSQKREITQAISMFAAALLLLFNLSGCSETVQITRKPLSGIVRGEAFYRERMALPPGTRFEVYLEEMSRSDGTPRVVGRSIRTVSGVPPYRFEIRYAANRIDRSRLYTIRAQLTRGGLLLFTTNQNYPVITRGGDEEPKLLLLFVRRQ